MSEHDDSGTGRDLLAFVDEAGAGGYSRRLRPDRDEEVGLMSAVVMPATQVDSIREAFRAGYDRFAIAAPEGGRLHVTDAFAPGNESWGEVAKAVRAEFGMLIRSLNLVIVYEARRLGVDRESFEHLDALVKKTREQRRSRIRPSKHPSKAKVEEELVLGLAFKLDAFCEEARCGRVDLLFDEIDEGEARSYGRAIERTANFTRSINKRKGWNPDTKSIVLSELHTKVQAPFRLETRFIGELRVIGKADPLVLVADIVANWLYGHLDKLDGKAHLNGPESILGWELEDRVCGVRDNAIEDLV